MFVCAISDYKFFLDTGELPHLYEEYYRSQNNYSEEIDVDISLGDGNIGFLAVQKTGEQKYLLVIAFGYWPAEPLFLPEMLFVAETEVLFLGAGERVLTYRLNPPLKIAEAEASLGFIGWEKHQQYIILKAEMQIAVWSLNGYMLWSQIVEPPYEYTIQGNSMYLTAFEQAFSFPLHTGPLKDIMDCRKN